MKLFLKYSFFLSERFPFPLEVVKWLIIYSIHNTSKFDNIAVQNTAVHGIRFIYKVPDYTKNIFYERLECYQLDRLS